MLKKGRIFLLFVTGTALFLLANRLFSIPARSAQSESQAERCAVIAGKENLSGGNNEGASPEIRQALRDRLLLYRSSYFCSKTSTTIYVLVNRSFGHLIGDTIPISVIAVSANGFAVSGPPRMTQPDLALYGESRWQTSKRGVNTISIGRFYLQSLQVLDKSELVMVLPVKSNAKQAELQIMGPRIHFARLNDSRFPLNQELPIWMPQSEPANFTALLLAMSGLFLLAPAALNILASPIRRRRSAVATVLRLVEDSASRPLAAKEYESLIALLQKSVDFGSDEDSTDQNLTQGKALFESIIVRCASLRDQPGQSRAADIARLIDDIQTLLTRMQMNKGMP
jgi:hypothetical protein